VLLHYPNSHFPTAGGSGGDPDPDFHIYISIYIYIYTYLLYIYTRTRREYILYIIHIQCTHTHTHTHTCYIGRRYVPPSGYILCLRSRFIRPPSAGAHQNLTVVFVRLKTVVV